MVEIDLNVPLAADLMAISAAVRPACEALGLTTTLDGSLASYPGCRHWHFKLGKQRGTLEVTVWEKGRRVWIKVQSGRQAPWIEEYVERTRVALEEIFGQSG